MRMRSACRGFVLVWTSIKLPGRTQISIMRIMSFSVGSMDFSIFWNLEGRSQTPLSVPMIILRSVSARKRQKLATMRRTIFGLLVLTILIRLLFIHPGLPQSAMCERKWAIVVQSCLYSYGEEQSFQDFITQRWSINSGRAVAAGMGISARNVII